MAIASPTETSSEVLSTARPTRDFLESEAAEILVTNIVDRARSKAGVAR